MATGLAKGRKVLQERIKDLPPKPGIYMMRDAAGEILYIGKAKKLSHRVPSYTQTDRLPIRLQRMVASTRSLDFVLTHTEAEALLLEANLIKEHLPKYNVLLKDDKAYPYVLIRQDHDFPVMEKHRGAKDKEGVYFGPFTSTHSLNETLTLLQKAFLLRNCSDYDFATRDRPCLQYYIKRCSAPCVGKITRDDYQKLVHEAEEFLRGRDHRLQEDLAVKMEAASQNLDFEQAAIYRDRIKALSQIQSGQKMNVSFLDDADVMAIMMANGQAGIFVSLYRAGQNFGGQVYFPRHGEEENLAVIFEAFLAQYYQGRAERPPLLLVNILPEEKELLEEALAIKIQAPQKGDKQKIIAQTLANLEEALHQRSRSSSRHEEGCIALADLLGLDTPCRRVEIYDNSHISGMHAVGVMVVANPEGFDKKSYRRFNIKREDIAPGDDYGMMREVLSRRAQRLKAELKEGRDENLPDLLVIDGGIGQYRVALEVLQSYELEIPILSIAKGEGRKAGLEKLFWQSETAFYPEKNHAGFHYLQILRDEAHRFAIGSHRQKRQKAMTQSGIEEIPGIGKTRKKALLNHFGSFQAIARAGIDDLAKVPGISRQMAETIYNYFQTD